MRPGLRDRLPLWLQTRCAVEPRALAALVVVLLGAAGFAGWELWSGRPEPVRVPAAVAAPAADPAPPSSSSPSSPSPPAGAERGHVLVDVAGEVSEPGVHRLPAGSRVADALTAAGGVRSGTDTVALNRARVLLDGEHILVGVTPPPGGPPVKGGAGPGPVPGPVSLNTATVEDLDTLPGIGPVLARKIVDHRTEQGGFRTVEQLRDVGGIGDSRFAELENRVVP
ncbi:ComEA family DNA-binding protein [Streptomyces chumphonensis]|uniref:ComEA family DNA-binding protein n=1 Tax=Streptomyces chumphonensis TaxID=1214925 RepID=UPI0031E71651